MATLYEPPAGSRMTSSLKQFKEDNHYPLNQYRRSLIEQYSILRIEDLAKRDGIGPHSALTATWAISVCYPCGPNWSGLELPAESRVQYLREDWIERKIAQFEEYKSTDWFIYDYFKILLAHIRSQVNPM